MIAQTFACAIHFEQYYELRPSVANFLVKCNRERFMKTNLNLNIE